MVSHMVKIRYFSSSNAILVKAKGGDSYIGSGTGGRASGGLGTVRYSGGNGAPNFYTGGFEGL
jgi:hypothetical protein